MLANEEKKKLVNNPNQIGKFKVLKTQSLDFVVVGITSWYFLKNGDETFFKHIMYATQRITAAADQIDDAKDSGTYIFFFVPTGVYRVDSLCNGLCQKKISLGDYMESIVEVLFAFLSCIEKNLAALCSIYC